MNREVFQSVVFSNLADAIRFISWFSLSTSTQLLLVASSMSTTAKSLMIITITTWILLAALFIVYSSHNVVSIHAIYSPIDLSVDLAIDRCACHQSDIKIFNLGFPKSGTESLRQLLNKIGCRAIHWRIENDPTAINKSKLVTANHWADITKKSSVIFCVAQLMQLAKNDNKPYLYYFGDEINGITQMDFCSKQYCYWPQLIDFKALDEQYPNSLFILMHRNITKHIISINNWFDMRQRLINANIPYLPSGKGKTDQEITNWINNHYKNVTEYFQFNANASGRFLSYDIENDKVEKLQQFIGCNENYSLSHAHNTAQISEKLAKIKGKTT